MVTLPSGVEPRTYNDVSVTIGMPKRIMLDRAAISIQRVAKSLNVSTITTVLKGSFTGHSAGQLFSITFPPGS